MAKDNFFFSKKTVCTTCMGKTCLECCSVEDDTECETIVCPTCGGKGYILEERSVAFKISIVTGAVAVIAVVLFFIFK